MAYLFINPNSTASMTAEILAAARLAQPEMAFEAITSAKGPAAIQGREDGAAAVPPLLELVSTSSADGIGIACFDDTGLSAAGELFDGPVVGIGQAAFYKAALRGWRFSVVTTLSVSVPIIEENIAAYGLEPFLGRVRASEIPVLELERDPGAATARILEEARTALAEDQVDAIVLGCAGMTALTDALRTELPVPLIDPVAAAATLLPALR